MSKKSILFVCLGNICRSPMAQTIFEDLIEKKGIKNQFEVDSAGLIDYHEGNTADARMISHAKRRNYEITHLSRPVKVEDFDRFDLIVAMDEQNVRGLLSLAPNEASKKKIIRMTDYLQKLSAEYIPDPYYGGAEGFEHVIDLLEDACDGLLKKCTE